MVQRWDPFKDLLTIQEQLHRLFESSMAGRQHTPGIVGWHPPADVSESEEALHLYIEIAGMSREEIDVRVEGDVLSIRGERHRPNPARAVFLQTEILMGPFQRVFKLPAEVESSLIQARYESGILEIVLPKKKSGPARQIEITTL